MLHQSSNSRKKKKFKYVPLFMRSFAKSQDLFLFWFYRNNQYPNPSRRNFNFVSDRFARIFFSYHFFCMFSFRAEKLRDADDLASSKEN